MLVANLAIDFQDLVAKVKNLVTLAPVLGAISCPELNMQIITIIIFIYCMVENDSYLSDFTVETAFFSR